MQNPDPLDLPSPQGPSASGTTADLHGVIRLVLDKSWLIVSCVVLAVIAAAVYVQRAPRVYEASTTVQVEQEDAKIVKAEHVVSEDLRGLDILNTVAQKLGNPSLLQQVLETNHLLPSEGAVVTNGSKRLTREETIAQFARNVKTSLRRNTRLIDTTVRNTDPQLAARLANSLVENYLAQDAVAQHTTTESANAFLQQEAERQKKKLEASEQALQNYRKKVGSVSLLQSQDIITPQLQDLNKRLTQSKANLVQAEGAYQDSLKMSSNVENLLAYTNVMADPEVAQISADVAKHENDFVVIRQRYREKHPKYALAVASLVGLKEQQAAIVLKVRTRIQEGLRITYQNALTSQQGLEQQVHETETNAMQLSDVAVRFNVLSREVESDKAQFDSIINRLGETKVEAQITPERIRVIQPALVPERPASPRIRLIFALALFGGLAVGLGSSFVLDSINTSFRTVDEVEQYLALTVLGTIPRLSKAKGKEINSAAAQDGNSPETEIFRTLRATLSMLGREKDRRTYLFTSSLPSEGKTFTSVNYAFSLAQQGLRTLLVDLDLRRPMVEEHLTGKNNHLPGVTDYFLGRKKFDELCVQHKDVPAFFWMPVGTTVPNPAELLARSDFQKLLDEGLAHYDRVVIDTAPLLPVSDTLLLAGKVQTVVVVVRSGKTPRKAVERAVQLLRKGGAPIGGVVLNLVPNRRISGYYYSYYHGYGYGHYGYGKKEADESSVDA
jgi:capsular exopolysaccharide synthesis family protein